MRHRLALLAASAAIAVTGIVAVPGVAHAEERVCRGSLGAVTVDNLRVPDRATCNLNGTRVKGTVKVESGATLRANNVNVAGNVQAEDHHLVIVRTSQVGGSIQLVQGGATGVQSAALTGNRVSGDVQLFENLGPQVVSNNRIDGNLQCKANRPAPKGTGNVVDGNREDQCRNL
jgi:hypothetical protein